MNGLPTALDASRLAFGHYQVGRFISFHTHAHPLVCPSKVRAHSMASDRV
jgi:hypothetical protein